MWGRVNVIVNINGKRNLNTKNTACPVILSKLGQKKRGEISALGLKSDLKICTACRSALGGKSSLGQCDFFYRIKINNMEVCDDTVFQISFSMPLELVDKNIIASK